MVVPIYEFSCLTCRHTFDVFGSYASRDESQVCPQCEGTNTRAIRAKPPMAITVRNEKNASNGVTSSYV